MEIKDSGVRKEFELGAMRDIGEGKGRCDLMPLQDIGDFLGDIILQEIGAYVYEGSTMSLERAIDEFVTEVLKRNFYEMLLELAMHYELGANKYEERNWEKGMPLHCYIDSGVRHYLKYKAGIADERHDLAFLWNMFGAIWTHNNLPKAIDLPFKEG